jgi:hypothetical protein
VDLWLILSREADSPAASRDFSVLTNLQPFRPALAGPSGLLLVVGGRPNPKPWLGGSLGDNPGKSRETYERRVGERRLGERFDDFGDRPGSVR